MVSAATRVCGVFSGRGSMMRNFREKCDIVDAAKGVISVVITVFASSLVVGPGSAGFLLAGRNIVREEKFTVHYISLVGRVAGAIASTNCSVHVPNNDGSAVA
eukprot:350898-Pelagomonas_calceolata.AAC.1